MPYANKLENVKDPVTLFQVDQDGFLIDPNQWTEEFAANVLNLSPCGLYPQHLAVIKYVRNKYLCIGALPPVRSVCKSVGIDKQELKILFGSCIQLWRAAGLPRPDDEIRSHMH